LFFCLQRPRFVCTTMHNSNKNNRVVSANDQWRRAIPCTQHTIHNNTYIIHNSTHTQQQQQQQQQQHTTTTTSHTQLTQIRGHQSNFLSF
jgi:hypothetical protein